MNCERTQTCPRPAYNKVNDKYYCAEHLGGKYNPTPFYGEIKSGHNRRAREKRCRPMEDQLDNNSKHSTKSTSSQGVGSTKVG